MRAFLPFLLLMVSVTSFGRSADDLVTVASFDEAFLTSLIKEKIDELRKEQGLPALEENKALLAAAKHHADYLRQTNLMSHNETSQRMLTPQLRAEKFGFGSAYVGENIAQSYINFGGHAYGNGDTYNDVANDLVDLWVNSKGHHKNLLHGSYFTTGMAISVDTRSGKIYVVQVFGGRAPN